MVLHEEVGKEVDREVDNHLPFDIQETPILKLSFQWIWAVANHNEIEIVGNSVEN